jgi:predicted PurR-regulated permease PerM
MTDAQVKLPFYSKVTMILVGIIATLYLLYLSQEVIVPLIFALFISILLNPMVNFLERKKVPKIIAISLGLIVAIIFIGALAAIISIQFGMLAKTYPELRAKFNQTIADNINWFAERMHTDASSLLGWLKSTQNEAMKGLSSSIGQTLMTVGNAMVVTVLVPLYIFLILLYKPLLLEFIRKLFDPKHHATVVEVVASIKVIIQSYLAGLLIEGLIVAVLNSIALLALGVEYAIILGITGAILNVIPYIGGVIGFGMPMIVAFLTKSPLTALLVLVLYSVIQFIDNHYLVPYIVASKVKINALVAIVVVLIGDALWGVPGMFLSIPLIALIKVIFDHIDALKPWGFLLGDDIPTLVKLPFFKAEAKLKREAHKDSSKH